MVAVHDAGIARIRSVYAFVQSREYLCGLGGGHIEDAAPDLDGGEAAGSEARDDAELILQTGNSLLG